MNKQLRRIALVVCAAALSLTALAGCGGQSQAQSEAEQAQAANRQYMSQVNQIMIDIEGALDDFAIAVESGDLSAMRSSVTEAGRSIDSLVALEAPEALSELQTDYAEGATQLDSALDAYIQLYTDVENTGGTMDSATFADRLAEVQQSYDAGVDRLAAADEKAAAMK